MCPLFDSKAVLFVNDHECYIFESDFFVNKSVRPYIDIGFPKIGFDACSRSETDSHLEGFKNLPQSCEVLFGEYLGWRHEYAIDSVDKGKKCRRSGDYRLAAADVSLQKTVHGRVP